MARSIASARKSQRRHGTSKETTNSSSSSSSSSLSSFISSSLNSIDFNNMIHNIDRIKLIKYIIGLSIVLLVVISLSLSLIVSNRENANELSSIQLRKQARQLKLSKEFQLTSTAFKYGKPIPPMYKGTISPQLKWNNIPNNTQSFVLIVEDPDAPDPAKPELIFKHWIVYNIPAHINELEEGIHMLPTGCIVLVNDNKHLQYDGPSPKIGEHRYYFRLYALNIKKLHITLPSTKTTPMYDDLYRSMKPYIIKEATLMGTFDSVHYN